MILAEFACTMGFCSLSLSGGLHDGLHGLHRLAAPDDLGILTPGAVQQFTGLSGGIVDLIGAKAGVYAPFDQPIGLCQATP